MAGALQRARARRSLAALAAVAARSSSSPRRAFSALACPACPVDPAPHLPALVPPRLLACPRAPSPLAFPGALPAHACRGLWAAVAHARTWHAPRARAPDMIRGLLDKNKTFRPKKKFEPGAWCQRVP